MKIHEKIRQARKAKNWSQAKTAKELNLSLNAYGSIERGETDPNSRRLEQIAQVFGMELAELVSDRNIFIFGGTHTNHCQNWYGTSPPEQVLQLQHELEKVRLVNQQQAKEMEYLRQQNADLREMVSLLKKPMRN